jgi:hypothetical protein
LVLLNPIDVGDHRFDLRIVRGESDSLFVLLKGRVEVFLELEEQRKLNMPIGFRGKGFKAFLKPHVPQNS